MTILVIENVIFEVDAKDTAAKAHLVGGHPQTHHTILSNILFLFHYCVNLTKIIFENVISIDFAKGIALLLRFILQGNGLKVAQKSPSNKFSV